jgi:dTDP-4-dehydrorhamnose reductase
MKLLVLGSGGQVGFELCRARLPAGFAIVPLDRAGLDITDRAAVFAAVARERPGLVVNAAAYTAVDRAESEPEAAFVANAAAPGHIAAACAAAGVPLIHLSTDYVFDGARPGPYREDDPINPLGVYGRSKADGEGAVRAALAEHVIVRTAWVYGAHGHNFVMTILRLAGERPALRVVADQRGAPTAAADIAAAIVWIASRISAAQPRWGTFHFAGAGETTWHGFAEAIVALAAPHTGKSPPIEPIATADYPTPARRPANSMLDCSRIAAAYGIVPRPWREALAEIVAELFADRAKPLPGA